MHRLSEDIMFFLFNKDWFIGNESRDFIYIYPPEKYINIDDFYIKLPRQNDSLDYQKKIDIIIGNLRVLYGNTNKKILNKFLKGNINTHRKHLNKEEWIEPDYSSRISRLGINEPYIPNLP